MISIDIDTGEIGRLAARLEQVGQQFKSRAIGRGLSKVAKSGTVAAKKEITSQYNIKSGEVAKRMSVVMSRDKTEARIRARSLRTNRIPLINFGAKQIKRGVSFSVARGKGRKVLKTAFIAKMPNGYKGVYWRQKGLRTITQRMGIEVTSMMTGRRVLPAVITRVNEQLQKVMVHELEFELRRLGLK